MIKSGWLLLKWFQFTWYISNIGNFWGFAKFCHNIVVDLWRLFCQRGKLMQYNYQVCNKQLYLIITVGISSKNLCSCISVSSYCPEQTKIIYGNVYWFDVKRFKNRYRILVECSFLPGFCDFSDHLPTVTLVALVWFLKIDHVKLLKACMLWSFLYGDVFSIIIHVTLMQYMWSEWLLKPVC